MAFKQNLIQAETINAGQERRILPSLSVERYDRLHFHISNGVSALRDLRIRILFGTPVGGKILLADSTIWYEDSISEREFDYTVPSNYGGTGLIMSVPVIAPQLYDVILRNVGSDDLTDIHVSVMAQEI